MVLYGHLAVGSTNQGMTDIQSENIYFEKFII